jgi:tetratricopeptide (TPR) repeat protein
MDYLEGNIKSCGVGAIELLAEDPQNSVASWFLAQSYLRTGGYDKALRVAEGFLKSVENPVAARALHGDVLDAMGKLNDAEAVRRSVISILDQSSNLDTLELVAGSRALRAVGEYEAANQCIQLAQDFDITDPFMKLEKAQLFQATQSYGIAAATAKGLTEAYTSIPLAKALWSDVLWEMRKKEEDVTLLAEAALAGDPTLLDARCRVIFYALLKDAPEEVDSLIAQNLGVNPNHRPTLNLERAAAYLSIEEGERVTREDDPDFASLMVSLMTAKNDYAEGLRWAEVYAKAQPDSAQAIHELGMANFRVGAYGESRALLERSLAMHPYAMKTRNLLAYIDGLADSVVTESGDLRVAAAKGENILARYAETRGAQILRDESKIYGVKLDTPLQVQFCSDLNDLAVITEGIPFGCCIDPAHPATTGVVSFDDRMFLWTPKATRGSFRNYRWDEALHRGIVQAVVRAATDNHAPLWLQEGVAGHAVWEKNAEWAPPNIGMLMANLERGMELPISGLAEGYLGSRRPFYQIYAPLLIQDWSERFGHESIQKLLSEIGNRVSWTAALETAFGQSIDSLDKESRERILSRYADLAERSTAAAAEAESLLNSGKLDEGAATLIKALARNPYDTSGARVTKDLLEALRGHRNRPEIYYRLLEATIYQERSDAEGRFELANWYAETDRNEEAVEYCQSAVGIRPEWLAAHRLLADLALKLERFELAYASLVTLHEARPKHVRALESLVICARALALNEESARWTRELQVLAPASPLEHID